MHHQVNAKKHLGQHFLNDQTIAKKIVDALLIEENGNTIIEIGPGTGVLTQYLLQSPQKFFALDVDIESIEYLKKTFPEKANAFIYKDFLKTDLLNTEHEKINIIGNFPYNISSQIMFKVLENRNKIDIVVGMFQKEVAERIAEKPGSKTYGILSVLLQAFYTIEYLFTVNENVFTPPPKVKSGVIKLKRNSVLKLNCDEALFIKVIKTAFNQRRKMIRNSILSLMSSKNYTHHLFNKRPEQLGVPEFIELTNFIQNN
ncbi:MAG: 16S rRNA (adenine(1518)-N(6)/adenine(1519)-N(6))-dimethyltransferase RsmA [Bacteroidetes bacterium]|nr:16S rRNA (adenine(1518)-N(6)/adenine(1519)-N(6))-dimethyltransferase RsmA [Bacteroidota bacterium]